MSCEKIKSNITPSQTSPEPVYMKATAEVIFFDNCDVVTASGGGGGGSSVTCYGNVFSVGCDFGW